MCVVPSLELLHAPCLHFVCLFFLTLHQQIWIFSSLREIDTNFSYLELINGTEKTKIQLIQEAIIAYEKKIGVDIKEPQLEETHWNIWGGVYYSASLYTTIGTLLSNDSGEKFRF